IYNDAVLNTTAIWNEQPVDLANRQAWYASRQTQAYPILVAVDAAGEVLGYSSFGDWRPFEGFRHTVEHSVYVRADQRGKGLGPQLMSALIERART
ncbi:GNAT family N-acetyltransferase, partial [Pseudomonas viridiflava]